MRDRGLIYTGLLIFLALATLPVWRNLSAGVSPKGPQPVLPAHEKQCVLPASYMKSSHMTLLLDWRERVVREGVRDYTSPDGRHFNMSLTNTCLHQCHTSKADFCDRCHNYEAVSLPCWDCHQDNKTPVAQASACKPIRLQPVGPVFESGELRSACRLKPVGMALRATKVDENLGLLRDDPRLAESADRLKPDRLQAEARVTFSRLTTIDRREVFNGALPLLPSTREAFDGPGGHQ